MLKLIVIAPSGAEHVVEGEVGMSLMEALRDAGVSGILAICGGACSCATCHVHILGGPTQCLSPMTNNEDDLLDGSFHRDATSRLSCQIRLTPELDGLRLRSVAED